ncbi:MAG: hypothetical protein PVF38_13035, partial [Desulfobacterales bacterium]
MRGKVITIGLLWVFFLLGCAAVQREKIPAESIIPEAKRHFELYADFVKENMDQISAHYSTAYVSCEFIVDIDNGSTAIQNLIDPASVAGINAVLRTNAISRYPDKVRRIYQYILSHYDYVFDPHRWQSVEETIRAQ